VYKTSFYTKKKLELLTILLNMKKT